MQESVSKIKLTQNQFAIIDSDDFIRVTAFKWYANYHSSTKSFRAMRMVKKGKSYTTILMSRFIFGSKKNGFVDHINHNTLDNRKSNLRLVTDSQNTRNRKKHSGLHKYKGIGEVRQGVFQARIWWKGKNIHLGVFHKKKEAALEYNKKAVELFGKYAHINKV